MHRNAYLVEMNRMTYIPAEMCVDITTVPCT